MQLIWLGRLRLIFTCTTYPRVLPEECPNADILIFADTTLGG